MAAKAKKEPARCPRCGEGPARHRPSDGCPYNGWVNYETWNVALWIGNEQGSYEHARELAREAISEAEDEDCLICKHARGDHRHGTHKNCKVAGCTCTRLLAREAEGILGDALKEWIEGDAPDLGASMFADLLNAALSEVEWRDIAEHYVDEARNEATR